MVDFLIRILAYLLFSSVFLNSLVVRISVDCEFEVTSFAHNREQGPCRHAKVVFLNQKITWLILKVHSEKTIEYATIHINKESVGQKEAKEIKFRRVSFTHILQDRCHFEAERFAAFVDSDILYMLALCGDDHYFVRTYIYSTFRLYTPYNGMVFFNKTREYNVFGLGVYNQYRRDSFIIEAKEDSKSILVRNLHFLHMKETMELKTDVSDIYMIENECSPLTFEQPEYSHFACISHLSSPSGLEEDYFWMGSRLINDASLQVGNTLPDVYSDLEECVENSDKKATAISILIPLIMAILSITFVTVIAFTVGVWLRERRVLTQYQETYLATTKTIQSVSNGEVKHSEKNNPRSR
ncbi:unnamed protein product [Bursaphelenchus xylophilus]|uniref:(pine wood nematode) hypothetical protein n=1 Tax=Bursaphelenchus xylophilus TaxID=6326 RepID=A0A811M0T2_BURXY|nr:unnamed protein product [Bursaphelenchus xylophilus]CAG9129721.1 unnamed protein product [Bursaphelenchus xylophilus]